MECDFLKEIRHPNIIQYLGMYRDPETGLPVLLMEPNGRELDSLPGNLDRPYLLPHPANHLSRYRSRTLLSSFEWYHPQGSL